MQRQLDNADSADTSGRNSAREALDTAGVYTTETDKSGNYTFAALPEGKYSITAYRGDTVAAQPRVVQATPAISKWTHGVSPTNSFKKLAALIESP